MVKTLLLAFALLLAATTAEAAADCDYRLVSLKDRVVTGSDAHGPTKAVIQRGMTGVVHSAWQRNGRMVYMIIWDGGMVLDRSIPGSRNPYYMPGYGITEPEVLGSEVTDPSVSCTAGSAPGY
jgi:hypothetical protein